MAFELPKLPYDFAALEPVIDSKTMELHHGKHHAAYTAKLNAALEGTEWESRSIEEILGALGDLPENIRSAVRNNGGGFYNHSLFWQVLCPSTDSKESDISSELSKAIENAFGGLSQFKEKFAAAATNQFGSGWAFLSVSPSKDSSAKELEVCSTANQDCPVMGKPVAGCAGTPILGLDVWEHAYYLNYQNRRPDYVESFWKIVNWKKVSENFSAA